MAAKTIFKQQCPSCEALVPIKDASLIGRKVDCPKCKYRFVVEDPGDRAETEDEAAEEAAPARRTNKDAEDDETAQGSGNGKAGVKTKPGGKRRDEEDKDGRRPKGKSKSGHKKAANFLLAMGEVGGIPVLGLVLGVVGIALLVVAGFFIFGGSGPKKPTPVPQRPTGSSNQQVASRTNEKNSEVPKVDLVAVGEDISNLLLPDTELVLNVPMSAFLKSPAGEAAFRTPGALRAEVLKRKFGFAVSDIERLIATAKNTPPFWSFYVVRLNKAVEPKTIQTVLGLQPAAPGQNQPYFVTPYNWVENSEAFKNWLNSRSKSRPNAPGSRPLAVYFVDAQTVVLGDVAPVQEFLSFNGHPPFKTQPAAAPAPGKGNTSGPAGMGGMPGMMGGMQGGRPGGGGGMPGMMGGMQGGRPGGGGGMPAGMQGGKPGMQGGRPGQGGMPAGMPGMPGMMGAAQATESAAMSNSYLTIKPELKAMLDRTEAKSPVAFSLSVDMGAGTELITSIGEKLLDLPTISVVGVALENNEKDGIIFSANLECADEQTAKSWKDKLRNEIAPSLLLLSLVSDLRLEMGPDQPRGSSGRGLPGMLGMPGMMGGMPGMMGGMPGMMPGGMQGGMPGGMPRGMQGGMPGMMGGMPGGMPRGMQGGMPGMMGGMPGMMPGGMQGGMPGMPRMPGMPGQGSQKTDNKKANLVRITNEGKTLELSLELLPEEKNATAVTRFAGIFWVRAKGMFDMNQARSPLYRLGVAVHRYVQDHQALPAGTQKRGHREGIDLPYPPAQRVSWLVDLLPYLDHEDIYNAVHRDKSWMDSDNQEIATVFIPEFLDPTQPPATWHVRYHGKYVDFAATHFVGIAGIGMEAAQPEFRDNPANRRKLGVFGYDRPTRVAEITDGLANTICMVQVPPTYKNAWLAGGGSTVRGVPESHSVQPFVCTEWNGKHGTFAIMCDGSVRFVPETISDAAFQALCTIAGGEQVDVNKEAPLVMSPDKPEPGEKPSAVDLHKAKPQPAPVVPAQPKPQASLPAGWPFPTRAWRLGANDRDAARWRTTAAAPAVSQADPKKPNLPDQDKPKNNPADDNANGLKKFSFKEGGFSVLMPGTPKASIRTVKTTIGNVDKHFFVVERGQSTYYMIYADHPAGYVNDKNRERILDQDSRGVLKSVPNGKLVKQEKISLAGYSGRDLTVAAPQSVLLREKMYLVKDRLYEIALQGPKKLVDSKTTGQFLDSFELLKK